jgi:hypothetical protein
MQREIGAILLRNWDPIGIRNEPEAQDEYVSYVGGVYRLLASGASINDIATHLASIETSLLGYHDTDAKLLVPVVKKLKAAYNRVNDDAAQVDP